MYKVFKNINYIQVFFTTKIWTEIKQKSRHAQCQKYVNSNRDNSQMQGYLYVFEVAIISTNGV